MFILSLPLISVHCGSRQDLCESYFDLSAKKSSFNFSNEKVRYQKQEPFRGLLAIYEYAVAVNKRPIEDLFENWLVGRQFNFGQYSTLNFLPMRRSKAESDIERNRIIAEKAAKCTEM